MIYYIHNTCGSHLCYRYKIELVLHGMDGDMTSVTCQKLSDLEDYYQPLSPGKECGRIYNFISYENSREIGNKGYIFVMKTLEKLGIKDIYFL